MVYFYFINMSNYFRSHAADYKNSRWWPPITCTLRVQWGEVISSNIFTSVGTNGTHSSDISKLKSPDIYCKMESNY